MEFKNNKISLNKKIITTFSIIMTLTIISIAIFINMSFKSEFKKYVNDSNMVEVNRLMLDLKKIYENERWNIEQIKFLGEDAIYKGIALEIYDKDENLVWSIFKDKKILSDNTIKSIDKNMQRIDNKWNGTFKEYKTTLYNSEDNIVGNAYIGHYDSTYYMENDMEFLKVMNKFMIIIAVISIGTVIIISIIISKSISKPIRNVSKIAKLIEFGNYKEKIKCKSNIIEVDELIGSINKLARALNDQEILRKRLTTDISHELRTPLTSIKGHIEAIIDGIWEPTNERLISINEEVTRLTKLVEELSKLSNYESEQFKLEKEIVNLKKLIKNIVYNYENKALEKNITINYNLENSNVLVDKKQLSQAIINILANAIKFTEVGGNIYIKNYLDENYINISIKDNGIGIPKKDTAYIFERFYRVDKSRNKETGGIGVGLSIAESILNAHNGKIVVNSEIGKGTEFIIKIPKLN